MMINNQFLGYPVFRDNALGLTKIIYGDIHIYMYIFVNEIILYETQNRMITGYTES